MPDVNANGIKWNRDEYMNIFDLEDKELDYYVDMFPDALYLTHYPLTGVAG